LVPFGAIGLGFLAGVLTILSPCVLPLLPLVLGPALSAHRFGLPALAAGLVVAFVGVGLFVATVGFSIGLDGDVFRRVAAVMLGLLGIVLLSSTLQLKLATAGGGISNAGSRLAARISPNGAGGQFVLGLLLGAIWSPCVGPTLGATSLLAAQGQDLPSVVAVMAAFGLGTALPLIGLGLLSRQAMARWRGRLLGAGKTGKMLLGAVSLAVAALILSGYDRSLETVLVQASPDWLTDLTTRF
jgi:cytochrome c-type biogenesis protein